MILKLINKVSALLSHLTNMTFIVSFLFKHMALPLYAVYSTFFCKQYTGYNSYACLLYEKAKWHFCAVRKSLE